MDRTTAGRRPNSGHMPRFRNVFEQETDYLRGYAAGFNASRSPFIGIPMEWVPL